MARAHAANACVQSDSIKGLAQSIAKPAYHRLLIAEPALRRAVPTLIIAFLITICLGAFVQVIDQNRQKRAAVKRDLAAARRHAGRAPRSHRLGPAGSRRQHRAAAKPAARPHSVLGRRRRPSRHHHRRRPAACWPAFPIETGLGGNDRVLDVISTAQLLAAPRPAGRRHRHDPAERQRRAGDLRGWSSRCPARSSSSRRRTTRSGDRTRRCR